MKPVSVSIEVPQPREEVFDFLDVLANHEQFNDHFLVDWEVIAPARGVGAKARMRVKRVGSDDPLEMEVVDAERPRMTVEESVSGKGRRRTRGTYLLDELPSGGTRITFELAWLEAPLSERLAAPLARWVVRRANARSLQRLGETLNANHGREKRS